MSLYRKRDFDYAIRDTRRRAERGELPPERDPVRPQPVSLVHHGSRGSEWTRCGKKAKGQPVTTIREGITCARCLGLLQADQPKPINPDLPVADEFDQIVR